jgi:hypothetical protein
MAAGACRNQEWLNFRWSAINSQLKIRCVTIPKVAARQIPLNKEWWTNVRSLMWTSLEIDSKVKLWQWKWFGICANQKPASKEKSRKSAISTNTVKESKNPNRLDWIRGVAKKLSEVIKTEERRIESRKGLQNNDKVDMIHMGKRSRNPGLKTSVCHYRQNSAETCWSSPCMLTIEPRRISKPCHPNSDKRVRNFAIRKKRGKARVTLSSLLWFHRQGSDERIVKVIFVYWHASLRLALFLTFAQEMALSRELHANSSAARGRSIELRMWCNPITSSR